MVNIKRTAMLPVKHKIVGVTHADTNLHSIDLTGIVPEGTIAVYVNAERISGTGSIDYYTFGDDTVKGMRASQMLQAFCVGLKDMKLWYDFTTAGDSFDITIFHAWVNRFD